MAGRLKRYGFLLLFIVACLCSVGATAWDRGLDLGEAKNPPILALKKAVCLADGLILGVTLMGFGMFLTGIKPAVGHEVEQLFDIFRGSFGLYSLIVGSFFCLWDFRALTILQLFTYVFSGIANWSAVRRSFQNP